MNDTAIQTVNVIELCDGRFCELTSFSGTPKGTKAAEEHFRNMIRDRRDLPDTETIEEYREFLERCVEKGKWVDGNYELSIVTSS